MPWELPSISSIENPSVLPPGNQDIRANTGNALQFLLENSNDEDKEYINIMHIAILHGFFIYLGNQQIQLTQLGYLFVSSRPEKAN